ncbi:MAG: response regulator [Croceibacterium sp.]
MLHKKDTVGTKAARAKQRDKARILLVDDDERNLLALSEVLEELAEVVCATSGRDALRALLTGDFAVILLDVFMPGMDGYETAGLIREREQTSKIPIIFLSAVNKETEHLMKGYAMGAVDYVFKPVDPIVLRSKVAVFVDLYLLRQQIAEQALAQQELREAKLLADTERLTVERELQHAQLRQAAILETLPLALYEASMGSDGRLTRRFIGGDVAKIAGTDALALGSGALAWEERIIDDSASNESPRVDITASSRTAHYKWTRSDGGTIHVIDQCVQADADVGSWVGTLIDVTAQRQLEQQLVQARKSEALGQLTGGVAHDFNNLLAAVLGGLRLLESRLSLGEREQQIFDHMRHAAQSGAELVRRLMAFARKQDLSPTRVDPRHLCSSVAGLVEHSLGDQVDVNWQVPEAGPSLYVDEAQLELALVNLLINARDAMPGGGLIDVIVEQVEPPEALTKDDEPPVFLRIRVRDQGNGIPAELLERVTEPFFTTKEAGKGTGLGLSMVAGFVEQSGGTVKIDSEAGKGTEIAMTFPATWAPDAAAETIEADGEQAFRIVSVLLVDDDKGVREILGEQLRDLGLTVTTAEDGQHALKALEENGDQPDFVLTDFSMPGLDGMELLSAVRERWPAIRGAIMTGNPQESFARTGIDVPIVHKPIDLPDLKRLLAEA